MGMYADLNNTIDTVFLKQTVADDRQKILQPLIDFVQQQVRNQEEINLNFICTHNSRRSILAQVWAQVAAVYYGIPKVSCYSGGTEATELFAKVAETLGAQGVEVFEISEKPNAVFAIKYSENALPVIGFSKKYDHAFNPSSGFAAIMTCSQADGGCPFIAGAQKRIPIMYEDPKIADGTDRQTTAYEARSVQIASEMFYVFSMIKK